MAVGKNLQINPQSGIKFPVFLSGSVMEGLAKFAHIINIEFFSDLIEVFKQLIGGGVLSYRDTLLAVSTVFQILSGQVTDGEIVCLTH